MPAKQLPTNHTFATKTKKGKQVGKQPKGEGVIYFMVSASNAITADDSDWVAVKVGLASGGEAEAFKAVSYTHLPSPRDRTRSRMPSSA